ncbi:MULTISPECIES: (2Fe-2S) ferredoxin domain-containing protein [unclassified Nostoc]|uniref:(2Fe-2S) ferredoxin domain-containing protein n=1 Tax=unclassified Nostoc TaxID=2593658 RepID=UPI002AD57DEB|nr:(2Fe-2S) ferredoxin domain-containing protein [Nostoc sp. DedQUE03]MDZ7975777.1 (2Fe-2S) ferredoxin domain-containing protein [Nostoc sp. DedQUE03]MDZ8048310.1 (2Fe-2S) ferredoxin domain-containing protein [Nostoc sp. DedQUE02]
MSNITQPSDFPIIDKPSSPRCVRVCQNRTCKKQGALKVLEAFAALPIPGVTITASSCLGQCGNGPMVLVLPDIVWYSGVKPDEVSLLVEHHLLGDQIVKQMLYYRFHPQKLN